MLKYLSFGCVCLILPVLAAATVLEKIYGAEFVHGHIYCSLPMVMLWGVISFFSLWYMLRVKLFKKPATFSLHLSLVTILSGALLTYLTGEQGRIHLRIGDEATNEFILNNGNIGELPFIVELKDFRLQYYDGTFSPSDFLSDIKITDKGSASEATVSMNHIHSYCNYRFYQSGYDADEKGSTLSVSHDPYGISVTYTGYVWLLLSIMLFFFQKKTLFREVLCNKSLRKGMGVAILMSVCPTIHAAAPTLPGDVAEEFGNLYIHYNGRIAPLNTFARDFTTKIYGKSSYKGLSAEQVVTGWFFFYDDWKNEPFIKIKGETVRESLGVRDDYVRLIDFVGNYGFKLDEALRTHADDYNNVAGANEKFNLISALVTGSMLKIYPFRLTDTENLEWYSVADKPIEEMSFDQWLFIRNSLGLVAEKVALKDWDGAKEIIGKIRKYQIKEAGASLPSEKKISAEKFYNKWNLDKPLAMACLSVGILLFCIFIIRISLGRNIPGWMFAGGLILMILLFLYLTIQLGLRWYVSGHIPLSNGFETMLFMSWSSAMFTMSASCFQRLALPFGFLLCGFTLLVAMIGEASPQITNLMPVLQSPLLSLHVMIIMMAYTLFAFTMLNGVAALVFSISKNLKEKVEYLHDVSLLLLYPAVFLLAIGIFIGAVWANVSWGRYWGWDPKEVWALITLLIYAMPLHTVSLSWFKRPRFFHLYCILAFISVLVTYFGVNFFLGGMHSYA